MSLRTLFQRRRKWFLENPSPFSSSSHSKIIVKFQFFFVVYVNFLGLMFVFSLIRQKALKALNERLQKLEQPTSWPTLDGPERKDSPQSPTAVDEMPEIVVDQGTTKRTEGVPVSSSVPT